jgi:hypothetical protein
METEEGSDRGAEVLDCKRRAGTTFLSSGPARPGTLRALALWIERLLARQKKDASAAGSK